MTIGRLAALLLVLAVTAVRMGTCRDDKATAGTIIQVLSATVILNDDVPASNDRIPIGARLLTDAKGQVQFRLEGRDFACTLGPNSDVTIVVGAMKAQDGLAQCDEGTTTATVEVGGATVQVGGGGVTVDATAGDAQVRVKSGKARVSAGGDAVTVNENEATNLRSGEKPTAPTVYNPRSELPENRLISTPVSTTSTSKTTTTKKTTTTTSKPTTTKGTKGM